MANGHDVAILDDVLLAFESKESLFLERVKTAVSREIVVTANFSANEMILQIGMNHAGRVLRVGSADDCPGTTFFFADREERNQTEQSIGGADQTLRSRFGQSVVAEEALHFGAR